MYILIGKIFCSFLTVFNNPWRELSKRLTKKFLKLEVRPEFCLLKAFLHNNFFHLKTTAS